MMGKTNSDLRMWFTFILIGGVFGLVLGIEEWQVYQVVGRQMHNTIRAKHNISALRLNDTLNRAAQEFAEHMLKEKSPKFIKGRSPLKNQQSFKEHIEVPLNANEAVKKAVTKWYSLITPAHWNNPNYTAFSALAWKGTTDLGVGVASNGHRTIVVAAYSHPGNTAVFEPRKEVTKKEPLVKKVSPVKIRPYVYTNYGFASKILGRAGDLDRPGVCSTLLQEKNSLMSQHYGLASCVAMCVYLKFSEL